MLFGADCPNLFVPDRFTLAPGCDAAAGFDALADQVADWSAGRAIHLIGFSMGCFAALQLAHRLTDRVSQIDLVSAAAPLEGGDFLPEMAGGSLFKLARDHHRLFGCLVGVQRLMARFAPRLLFALLFGRAQGGDRALIEDQHFRQAVRAMLRTCFAGGSAGYTREIRAYVRPWAPILGEISAPVRLWHGSADNWAPLAMAHYLESALPNVTGLEVVAGASHYSALRQAMGRICGVAQG
jgi:pimeloyl-ACP methyl ester carboxylesterase